MFENENIGSIIISFILIAISYVLHTYTVILLPADSKCFAPAIVWTFTCLCLRKGLGFTYTILLTFHIVFASFLCWKFSYTNALLNRTIIFPVIGSILALILSSYIPYISTLGITGIAFLQIWSIISGILMFVVFPATVLSNIEPQSIREARLNKFMRLSSENRNIERIMIPSRANIFLDALIVRQEQFPSRPLSSSAFYNSYLNSPAQYWVVYFGGNAELMEDTAGELISLSELIPEANWVMYNPRGVGKSKGYISTIHNLREDALAVVGFIMKKYKLPANKILLWGHSIGGGIAATVAAHYNNNNYNNKKKSSSESFPVLLDRTFSRLSDAAVSFSPLTPAMTRVLIRYTIGDFDVVGDCKSFLSYNNNNNSKEEEEKRILVIYHRMDEIIKYDIASLGRQEILREIGLKEFMTIELPSMRGVSPHNSPLFNFEKDMYLYRRIQNLYK